MKRVRTVYRLTSPKISQRIRFAVASDLHSGSYEDLTADFEACDAVLIPGDLVDRHSRHNERAYRFLEEVPKQFPVFYSLGNHERKFQESEQWMASVARSEIMLLDNDSRLFMGIRIGGLSSVPHTESPDTGFLDRYEKETEYKLLLCHQPEVYRDTVRGRDIDCTLCGHAHGGQIQIFGRGLYSPGQGLFPKLTHGIHDGGKMIISRGLTNNTNPRIPRFNNPCELILLEMIPGKETKCETEETTK